MTQQHRSKAMKDLLDAIERMGFAIVAAKKGVKIIPPAFISGPIYHTHATESAYHQVIRDFRKLYGVELVA